MEQALLILFCCVSCAVGLFLSVKPELAIEIQKQFYAFINWRIEPISFVKELRNTRVMGVIFFFGHSDGNLSFF